MKIKDLNLHQLLQNREEIFKIVLISKRLICELLFY